jgi:hypothetical protein
VITLVAFVVLVLATARLTRAVSMDDITAELRLKLCAKWGQQSKKCQLIWCYWCSGFWIAGLTSLFAEGIAVATHLLPWPAAAASWLLLWPATAYAASWLLDREGNDGVSS